MDYNIPLFKLNFGQEEIDAVTEIIKSKWISTGPKCEELENQFVEMFNVLVVIVFATDKSLLMYTLPVIVPPVLALSKAAFAKTVPVLA